MADFAQAAEKMKSLRLEFETVAKDAGAPKFFQSWFDDSNVRQNDFKSFAILAGMAEGLLAAEQPTGAKIAIDGLKGIFDGRAAKWTKAAHGFFRSWSGREAQEAARWQGYANKVAEIQKLL